MKRLPTQWQPLCRAVCWLAWLGVLYVMILTVRGNSVGGRDLVIPDRPKLAVFIHGAGGGGWEWRQWVPLFEKAGYTCVAEDLVPSSNGLANTRFTDYLDQVEGWALKPKRVVLIGASMGGVLALRAAMDVHPAAVVLVNSVGPAGIGKPKTKEHPPIVRWANGSYSDTAASMPDSDEPMRQFAWKHWRDESGAVLDEITRGITVTKPSCPVLVILGSKDTDVPPSVGKQIATEYGGTTRLYEGMSHISPLLGTKAGQVALDTLDWLAQIA